LIAGNRIDSNMGFGEVLEDERQIKVAEIELQEESNE
jgi:hypothetical protein